MLKTAVVGMGWWGGALLDSIAESDLLTSVAAYSRSRSPKDQELARKHGVKLVDRYETLLADPEIEALILATPPSGHHEQIVAAAKAGKHVFSEKPFVMSAQEAVSAVAAVKKAGVTLGLGYNRRFHPSWIDLRRRIREGELGVILHLECTMTGPNGLTLPSGAWRASTAEAPLGGLFPMGVHAVDGFIDLVGNADQVFCQSLHRVVPGENDDTTSILLRMQGGMSAYLGIMTATAGSFRFQVYGSKAVALLGGMTHVAGQSSHQRRAGLFGTYLIQPVGGAAQAIEVPEFDPVRAELEAFARAARGEQAYPIPLDEMIHGVAITDAIMRSARSGTPERVHT